MTRQANKAPLLLLALGALAVLATLLVLSLANRATRQSAVPAQASERLVRADSPALGPDDAKVTVVEFFDPECESCRAIEPDLIRLLDQYEGQVRLVARYFPLHANSLLAAGTIEAAAQQGGELRWRMRDYLFEKQPEWGEQQTPQKAKFLGYAQDMGLDLAQVEETIESASVRDLVERDRQDGLALGVSGTPTFFVNGERLTPLSVSALERAIQDALNR
ncbi:thioredoxin domain-containing protein [Deinococcus budaensis]|uniref:Protein-disulfide isomerase n=1 Tax=Deinococcus budaensis TaxID=1665626 RepID=A0A7W8GFF9_9DEIO|nr:protein-disulfide isomerase [Deinococcus budaensis]